MRYSDTVGQVTKSPMTDTKHTHTPGPWALETVATSAGSCHKIGPFPSLGVYEETHACVYADSVRIGIDDKGGVCKVADELLANARLIAAAPELLEALYALLNFEGASDAHTRRNLQHAEIKARAAIAKATGTRLA